MGAEGDSQRPIPSVKAVADRPHLINRIKFFCQHPPPSGLKRHKNIHVKPYKNIYFVNAFKTYIHVYPSLGGVGEIHGKMVATPTP